MKPGASHVDPRLIRAITIAGWCWAALSLVAAVVFTAVQAPRLPSTVWFFVVGGRSSASAVHRFATGDLVLLAWVVVAVFAVVMLVCQLLGRPDRSWPLLLVVVLSFFSAVAFSSLLTSAAPQVGIGSALDESTAFALLRGLSQASAILAGLVALATVLALPLVVTRTRSSSRTT